MSISQFVANSIRNTIANIRSHQQVFWVSIVTITIAISILGLFLVIFVNLNAFLATWNQQVQLIVYLKDGVPADARSQLENVIADNEDVESHTFIPSDEAWKNFKTTFSGKSGFVANLDFNPLPSSYEVRFRASDDRLARIRDFADKLKDMEGVESLEYGEKWLGSFEKFMVFIRIFLMAVGGLLALGLILIVSNTIKLSYYSRQDEIELMLLIGATHRYIKIPFLLEGMLQGFLGAVLALSLIKSLQLYLKLEFQGSLETIARGVDFQFLSRPLVFSILAASVFIGWMGSYLSIKQFLQVELKK